MHVTSSLSESRIRHGAHLAALALTTALTACATHTIEVSRPAHFPNVVAHAGLSAAERALLSDNCGPFGAPEKDPTWAFGRTQLIVRAGYALEHNSVDKIALWVCEGVVPGELTGNLPRENAFAPDPELRPGERAELADYRGSGYSRGHMAPAGNQTVDRQLKRDTFFLSNMAPQLQSHNSPTWSALEDLVRDWVAEGTVDGAHVITGGFFYDPAEERSDVADGEVVHEVIGPNRVAVPTHFYKVVLGQKNGQWQAIAFSLEHKAGMGTIRDYTPYVVSIDWLEERTGLNFFPTLSLPEEVSLEQQPSAVW